MSNDSSKNLITYPLIPHPTPTRPSHSSTARLHLQFMGPRLSLVKLFLEQIAMTSLHLPVAMVSFSPGRLWCQRGTQSFGAESYQVIVATLLCSEISKPSDGVCM